MKDIVLGIIGGKGKMGHLFKEAFASHVKDVLISDLDTPLSKRDVCDSCDVVIISVPMQVTEKVIQEIIPYMRSHQLLLDLTSLKKRPCEEMLKSKASVIGLHPLFGPLAGGVKGQRIVLCPVREGKWKPWLKEILHKEGCFLEEMTPEQHDQRMAIVQALVHFSTLVFAETVREDCFSLAELFDVATPVFQMDVSIAKRVLSQSSSLYAAIEMENPFFPQVLEQLEENLKELKRIVLKKDTHAFTAFFERCAQFFKEG